MGQRLLLSISSTLLRAKLAEHRGGRGVMFSITMFVTLLGFMNGLNTLLDGLILNRTPHIRIYNELQASPHSRWSIGHAAQRAADSHAPLHPLA
jgi:lipoprotein-releasing system permease protein